MTRSYVRVKLVENGGAFLTVDDVDNTLVSIDFPHHEIHEGNHYTADVFDNSVDIAAPKIVRLTTPASLNPHLITNVSGNGGFLMEFYENPTVNAAGTGITIHNNDRTSGNTSICTVFQDTTTQVPNNDGTLLVGGYSGGERKKSTAESGQRQEWILKASEDYLVKVTPDANGTKINVVLAWYEPS